MQPALRRNWRFGRAADWLLLLYIFVLPLMKPQVADPVIAADLLCPVVVLALAVDVIGGSRKLKWLPGYGALLVYFGSLIPSVLGSPDIRASLFKLMTDLYLVMLAAGAASIVDSEAKLRTAMLVWIAATGVLCADAALSLLCFATGWGGWLLDYSWFGFGSLPPGDYPRLSMTFLNANMACNYLTVSLALVFAAGACRWISKTAANLLLAGIAIASLSTISPGLGGLALLAGVWIWYSWRRKSAWAAWIALLAGGGAAACFVLALAVTPFPYPTAPFLLRFPFGVTLYPAPRLLTWEAGIAEFARHPLIGGGLGINPVHVLFASPAGGVGVLTDTHNIFISLAAHCGLAGLFGLGAILLFATRCLLRSLAACDCVGFLLSAAFLDAAAYQGLGGSFENTRHIWLLLGLLIARHSMEFSRADGSNRRGGAPSHC